VAPRLGNSVTCNGVTEFVTFSVFFVVFDCNFRTVIVKGIKYNILDVFYYFLQKHFFNYSVLSENNHLITLITLLHLAVNKKNHEI